MRYESSTLILYKELSSSIFQMWVSPSVNKASVTPLQISTFWSKFLENKIYTEKRQFLPIYTEICTEKRQFLPIFRVKSEKNLHRPKKIYARDKYEVWQILQLFKSLSHRRMSHVSKIWLHRNCRRDNNGKFYCLWWWYDTMYIMEYSFLVINLFYALCHLWSSVAE